MAKYPTYRIQNVVVSANLFKEIPLEKLAKKLPNTEYNPEQFPGLVLRLNEEKGKRITALVFSSGKIVCTGTKGEGEVRKAVNNVIKELAKAGVKITKRPEISIQNMVASGDLGMSLNLNKLAFKLPTAEYEPEQFPGLVYKDVSMNIVFLLFGTGKIVITGAKNEKQIGEAVRKLYRMLKKL